MYQKEKLIGLSLGHYEKPEGGVSQLLDRHILNRCLFEPREVVPRLKSQELLKVLALSGEPSAGWLGMSLAEGVGLCRNL